VYGLPRSRVAVLGVGVGVDGSCSLLMGSDFGFRQVVKKEKMMKMKISSVSRLGK
jgi:hypothetical protein